MIKYFKPILSIIRIQNLIIGFVCCLIACMKLEYSISINDTNLILGFLIVFLIGMSSNILNDIFDIKTDSINRPESPLIKYPELKSIFSILGFGGSFLTIILSLFLNFNSMLIAISSMIILIAYTPIFKRIPLLGNLICALILGLSFIFIESVLLNTMYNLLIPSVIASALCLIREIIKDIEDYKGDKAASIYTLAVMLGIKRSIYFSIILIVIFILSLGMFIINSSSLYFVIAVFFLVFLPLFYLIFFLIKSPAAKTCSKASNLLKKIIILGLLLIYIL